MKRSLFVCLLLCLSIFSRAQQIPKMSMEQVINYTSSKDTLYIINFWATWCAPCVAELPEFNKLKEHYKEAPVKILLVSLDFKEDYPNKLGMFIQRKRMTPEVVWLSDTDPNVFIPKVDNRWQGSIPATMIIDPGKGFRKFIEGTITERQVQKVADMVLSHERPESDDE